MLTLQKLSFKYFLSFICFELVSILLNLIVRLSCLFQSRAELTLFSPNLTNTNYKTFDFPRPNLRLETNPTNEVCLAQSWLKFPTATRSRSYRFGRFRTNLIVFREHQGVAQTKHFRVISQKSTKIWTQFHLEINSFHYKLYL